jgi:acyl carrier protein
MVDKIPYGETGEIEVDLLRRLKEENQEKFDEPRDETEIQICNIMKNVVGQQKIGIHQNFFEIGGKSMLAIQLLQQIRETFQISLPLQFLFQSYGHGTIACIAKEVKRLVQSSLNE